MGATPEFYVKAHSDYYIGEKKEQHFEMISHVDELITLAKLINAEDKPRTKGKSVNQTITQYKQFIH